MNLKIKEIMTKVGKGSWLALGIFFIVSIIYFVFKIATTKSLTVIVIFVMLGMIIFLFVIYLIITFTFKIFKKVK